MALEHVAHHPGLLVVAGAVLDPDAFRRRDLHVVHVLAVPDRLEDRVGEPEHEEVLDSLLREVMVDAVDLVLGERLAHHPVQRVRAREAGAERLLQDHPHPGARRRVRHVRGHAARREVLDGRRDDARRDRQVDHAAAAGGQSRLDLGEMPSDGREGRGVREVAGDVREARGEALPQLRARMRAELVESLAHRGAERRVVPSGASYPHDRAVVGQQAVEEEVRERGDELPAGEVTARPDDHQHARLRAPQAILRRRRLADGLGDRGRGSHAFFTACPPNSFRRAAMTFAPKESVWRERKRARSARVMAGAGTSRSIAVCTVQRPSPESST